MIGLVTACYVIAGTACAEVPPPSAHIPVADDFDGADDPAALGWRIEAEPEQSVWRIRDGRLEVVCPRNPYKGGRIVKEIPALDRGSLQFDMRSPVAGGADYNHLSLGFRIYGHMTSFKNYGRHTWLGYRPEQRRHLTLATGVPLGKWTRIRVVFDIPRKRFEYYCGEGEDPVFVDPDVNLDLEKAPRELEFFNYGLCTGTVTHRIDNVVLRGAEDGAAAARSARDGVLVFEGVTAVDYGVSSVLQNLCGPERLHRYVMETRGAAILPRNKFALRHVPGLRRWSTASHAVLVDVPAVPSDALPSYLLTDLADSVRAGLDLIIFGGMFAFGKGGYAGTPLEDLLPVRLAGPWSVRRFAAPQPIEAAGAPLAALLTGPDRPTLLWYHDLQVRSPGAEVLLTAGGRPVAVRGKAGEGNVTVFLGTVCGNIESGGSVAFWRWSGWPGLVGALVRLPGQ
jgi:hypothetical protein